MRTAPSKVYVLGKKIEFPAPDRASSGLNRGLLAVGGDLSVPRMLLAYRMGIFPWSVDPITWWSPDPRGIFELDEFHTAESLRKTIRRNEFEVRINQSFQQVMERCSRPNEPGCWISPEFIEAYTALHLEGHAHSVESWQDGELAGGIYGVAIGGLFAGESMFYRKPNASKVAVHALVCRLRERGFRLFDIQMVTPATERMGAVWIPRKSYLSRLAEAVKLTCNFV